MITPPAWFPVLESNQGALSLFALLLAIVLALWEQHRAHKAQELAAKMAVETARHLREEEIVDALALIEGLTRAFYPPRNFDDPPAHFSELRRTLPLQSALLRGCALANAKRPELAMALLTAALLAEDVLALGDEEAWMREESALRARLGQITRDIQSSRFDYLRGAAHRLRSLNEQEAPRGQTP